MVNIDELHDGQSVQLSTLQYEFEGKLVSETMKPDEKGKIHIEWRIQMKDGGQIVQRFGSGMYNILYKVFQNLNITNTSQLLNRSAIWRKTDIPVLEAKPRWLPVSFAQMNLDIVTSNQ